MFPFDRRKRVRLQMRCIIIAAIAILFLIFFVFNNSGSCELQRVDPSQFGG